MKFKGLVIPDGFPVYIKEVTFTKTLILVSADNPENKIPYNIQNPPLHHPRWFPNRTPYKIEFLDKDDAERTYNEISITYKGIDGNQHSAKVKATPENIFKAKWMFKQYQWIQNKTTESLIINVISAIIGAIVGALITWMLSC